MTKPKKPAAKLPKPVKAWGLLQDGVLWPHTYITRVLSGNGIKCVRVLISIPPKPRKVK